MNTKYLIPTRVQPGQQRVPGVLSVAALAGMVCVLSGAGSTVPSAITDSLALKLANGDEGTIYFNYRQVVNQTAQTLNDLFFLNQDVLPVLVNQPVDLIQIQELEAEGGDNAGDGLANYLITGGDANHQLAGTESPGQRLTVLGGKWGKYYPTNAATEAVYGRLVQWLTPADSGNLRALIEVFPTARFDKLV